jgi:hypothetical protein
MISCWSQHKRTVIVDLFSHHAREALTETREALKGDYLAALNELLGHLETESETALRTLDDEHVVDFSGDRGDVVIAGVRAIKGNDALVPATVAGALHIPAISADHAGVHHPVERGALSSQIHGSHSLVIVSRRLKHQHGLQKGRRRFFPGNWKGERPAPAQILTAWLVACRCAIEAIQRLHSRTGASDMTIRPGFLFEPADTVWGDSHPERMRTAGECRRNKDGTISLLINPVDDDGRIRYRLTQRKGEKGLQAIIALAAHEACHIAVSKHNELFARLLTEVMSTLDIDATVAAIRVELQRMRLREPVTLDPYQVEARTEHAVCHAQQEREYA